MRAMLLAIGCLLPVAVHAQALATHTNRTGSARAASSDSLNPREAEENGTKADAYKVGITPQDCGAVGDGVTDDTMAVDACELRAFAANRPLLLTSYYRMTAPFVVDTTGHATTGVRIVGTGVASTGLKFDSTVAAPNFLVEGPESGASFYSRFEAFNVQCSVAGVCVQFGRSDMRDQLNEFVIDLLVQTSSKTATTIATELNDFYQGDVRLVSNAGGKGTGGTALLLQRTQFSRIFGSFGNADTALHLAGSYTVSNTFDTLDVEEVTLGVLIDSATAINNTFRGGHVADVTHAVSAKGGSGNRWESPDLGIPSSDFYAGPVTGFEVQFGSHAAVAGTPRVPASGVSFTNELGQSYFVNLLGGAVSSVTVAGSTVCTASPCSFLVHQGQAIVVTDTATPSWTWAPL